MSGKDGKGWELVSDDAKDFVRRCLVVSVEDRATVEQCLAHCWLVRESQVGTRAGPWARLYSPLNVSLVRKQRLGISLSA